jgi:hypothetical protein
MSSIDNATHSLICASAPTIDFGMADVRFATEAVVPRTILSNWAAAGSPAIRGAVTIEQRDVDAPVEIAVFEFYLIGFVK